MIVNKNMKSKLSKANIDPYSSEGRSEIYCRFVLENPKDLVSISSTLVALKFKVFYIM